MQPQAQEPPSEPSALAASAPTPAPVAIDASGDNESLLIELSKKLECTLINAQLSEQSLLLDNSSSMNSSSNNTFWARMFNQQQAPLPSTIPASAAATGGAPTSVKANNNKPSQMSNQTGGGNSGSNNAWLELFADLDPLANPQAFDLKMSGGRRVAEQT